MNEVRMEDGERRMERAKRIDQCCDTVGIRIPATASCGFLLLLVVAVIVGLAGVSTMLAWLRRPSLWVALITVVAYWDETALHGSFVYDDAGTMIIAEIGRGGSSTPLLFTAYSLSMPPGSIQKNLVVTGQVPLHQVWTRDFWSTNMTDVQSHKSFRPLTTLTFRANWVLAEKDGKVEDTFGFHVVNVGLHGLVTLLVTEISDSVLAGLLFGLHPVHAEAVSNLTSRGELLMSLFYLLAFLTRSTYSVVPWICMALSMLCKEQGATALISVAVYELLERHESVLNLRPKHMGRFLLLAVQTLVVCGWRYWWNGETSPDFIFDQNPAGFSTDRFTRVFSVNWVYCLYLWDMIYPMNLCPDWSGKGIDLIEEWKDPRVAGVLSLWCLVLVAVRSLFFGPPASATPEQRLSRRIVLMAFFGFTLTPFLLSSNLLVVVGLMKADRVIYLPLMGFCILEAWMFEKFFGNLKHPAGSRLLYAGGHLLVLCQLGWFAGLLHQRNVAWSSPLSLWMSAYKVNPKSHHTIYNCGYELSLKQRYAESEEVLFPIADPHVDGPSNTFVYAMVLYNLQRCEEAEQFIDAAIRVVQQKRRSEGPRNRPKSLDRVESNLLVARGFCATKRSLKEAGPIMYEAVQKDPTNEYAIQQAQALLQQVEIAKKTGSLF